MTRAKGDGAVYAIKPLEWTHTKTDDDESWCANTVFCELQVKRNSWESGDGSWSAWRFKYCRDEYYNEHTEQVDSAEDGKAKAEKWYHETLMPALDPSPARKRKEKE